MKNTQDFLQEGLVNNPNIAHADHLLYDLTSIGLDGAWDRTGQCGVTVQSYIDEWDDALKDVTRDPVVTVIRGLYSQADADKSNPIIYVFLGMGAPRCESIESVNYTVDGVTYPFSSTFSVIDENNVRADLLLTDNVEKATAFTVLLNRPDGDRLSIPFRLNDAATDLYEYSAVSSIAPYASVEQPVTRNSFDGIYSYSGGVLSCYLGRGAEKEASVTSLVFSRSGDGSGGVEYAVTTSAPSESIVRINMEQFQQIDLETMFTYANCFVKYSPSGNLVQVTGELFRDGSESESFDARVNVYKIIRNSDGTFAPVNGDPYNCPWLLYSAGYKTESPDSLIPKTVYTTSKVLMIHCQTSDNYNENIGNNEEINASFNGKSSLMLRALDFAPGDTSKFVEIYPDMLANIYVYPFYWFILESTDGLKSHIGPYRTEDLFVTAEYEAPTVKVQSLTKTGDSYTDGNTIYNGVWTVTSGKYYVDGRLGENTTVSIDTVSMSNTTNYATSNPSYNINVTASSTGVTQIRLLTGSYNATGERFPDLLPQMWLYTNYWLVTTEKDGTHRQIGPLRVSDLIQG